jgi:hypothetical protein
MRRGGEKRALLGLWSQLHVTSDMVMACENYKYDCLLRNRENEVSSSTPLSTQFRTAV